jgi:SAM-dependent methyltransferase
MGLVRGNLHIIAMEHREHPVRGRVLVLSQQAVYATPDEVREIIVQHGGVPCELKKQDTRHRIPGWKGTPFDVYTNCQAAMMLMGAQDVKTCDISDYEGADYLFDLNLPCPENLVEQFDTIVDMGTLEHLFNVPQALENVHRMLRPGGHVILGTMASNSVNHGFYSPSPTLLHDYFAACGYKDFRCYLRESSPILFDTKCKVYRLSGRAMTAEIRLITSKVTELMFFARKPGRTKAAPRSIAQSTYTNMENWSRRSKRKQRSPRFAGLVRWLRSATRWRPAFVSDAVEHCYSRMQWRSLRREGSVTYLGRF